MKPIHAWGLGAIAVAIAAVTGYWWACLLVIGISIYLFKRWKNSETGRGQWDAFRLRIPFKIGDIVQKVSLARWSRTLSALVSAGVPLMQALDITSKTAGNRVVENVMDSVIDSVKQGGTIAEPLKAAPVFPGMVTQMVAVGEETGALDAMLSKIADFYEDQVEASVKSLTSILEPLMLVVVGGIIPDEDVAKLKAAGIDGVFGPGTSSEEYVAFLREHVQVAA